MRKEKIPSTQIAALQIPRCKPQTDRMKNSAIYHDFNSTHYKEIGIWHADRYLFPFFVSAGVKSLYRI